MRALVFLTLSWVLVMLYPDPGVLVRSVRKGRETLFEFDAAPIETMTQYLDLVSSQWEQKLSDLQSFLDE